jgi:L-alanine-DL-glutamate epimerase-like enolase superfamily enzyme
VFRISRGSRTQVEPVVVELEENGAVGRGECIGIDRYGESVHSIVETIETLRTELERGLGRADLAESLPPGAARNALDCALWDLEAKSTGKPVWTLAGLSEPQPLVTAFTLGIDSPENMAAAALRNADRPLLKLKLIGAGDLERVAAVRKSVPRTRLIVDANEAWSRADYEALAPALDALKVEMIEQPFKAGDDAMLADLLRPVAVCADESCHDATGLERLACLYDVINIKLDKTGGLTEALKLRALALERGLAVMVGCMVATSLAMAPATLVAQGARYVDLDGPLLLARDRRPGLSFAGSTIQPPSPTLWG